MKIRILESSGWYMNNLGKEFGVKEYYDFGPNRFELEGGYWVDKDDCVITELPKSFCVKRCDDNNRDDWNKYIKWLNRIYDKHLTGDVSRYYGANIKGECDNNHSFATELHIDDIIKHIDFYSEPMVVESDEEFDMTTPIGRLAYAKRNYPIGTKYIPRHVDGFEWEHEFEIILTPVLCIITGQIEGGRGYIYSNGKWAEIIDKVKEEFDMTTPEGRLAYAKKHYPVGTKYRGLDLASNVVSGIYKVLLTPRDNQYNNIDAGPHWIYLYKENKWAEIINEVEEEIVMKTQQLSRQGLKEIHSIACSNWKAVLERYGANSPLEDYIELTQEQVNNMFKACTKEQLPIVSKYLKQDDGSVDLSNIKYDESGGRVDGLYILRHDDFDASDNNSFWLNNDYDWILKVVKGHQRLYPTKKK